MRLIVLLGHENDAAGVLSADAVARCEMAVSVAKAGEADFQILPTGGIADYFNPTEVAHGCHLRDELCRRGVEAGRILPSTLSAGTLEDAQHVAAHIKKEGFSGVLHLVTSEFHMERASYLFGRVLPGLCVECHPAANQSSGERLAGQRAHEAKRLAEMRERFREAGKG